MLSHEVHSPKPTTAIIRFASSVAKHRSVRATGACADRCLGVGWGCDSYRLSGRRCTPYIRLAHLTTHSTRCSNATQCTTRTLHGPCHDSQLPNIQADWRLPCCTLHVLLQLVHGIARASRRAFSNMRLSSTVASQTVGRSFSPAAHGAQREDAKVINADWRMWHFTHTVTHQRTKHPRACRTRPCRRAPAILSNSKAIGFRRVAESSSAARVCKTTLARGVETRPQVRLS